MASGGNFNASRAEMTLGSMGRCSGRSDRHGLLFSRNSLNDASCRLVSNKSNIVPFLPRATPCPNPEDVAKAAQLMLGLYGDDVERCIAQARRIVSGGSNRPFAEAVLSELLRLTGAAVGGGMTCGDSET